MWNAIEALGEIKANTEKRLTGQKCVLNFQSQRPKHIAGGMPRPIAVLPLVRPPFLPRLDSLQTTKRPQTVHRAHDRDGPKIARLRPFAFAD